MPINRQQRLKRSDEYLKKYFPTLTEEQRKPICEMITNGFDGNYSPVRREQDSRHAIGQGATFEEFSIAIAKNMTHLEPVDVSHERMGDIIRKVWTF